MSIFGRECNLPADKSLPLVRSKLLPKMLI